MRSLSALVLLLAFVACSGSAPPPPPPASTIPIDPRVAVEPRPSARSAPSAAPAPRASPVDGALPAVVEAVLERKAECKAPSCALRALVPEALAPSAEDKAPVSVWEQAIAAGSSVSLPRDAEVDLLGLTLRGKVELVSAGEREGNVSGPLACVPRCRSGSVDQGNGGGGARAARHRDLGRAGPCGHREARREGEGRRLEGATSAPRRGGLARGPISVWDGGARHARLGFEPADSPRASLGAR